MENTGKILKFRFAPPLSSRLFCGKHFARGCAVVLFLICSLASCRSEQANRAEMPAREVTDDLGRKIKIPPKPERAVSLAPNLTENIFAVGAGNRLVGVTTFCNYPAEAEKIAKIGDTMTPNMEAIIALKPQIVFVSTASQIESFARTLEQQNIAVFVTNPTDLEGVYRNLYQLGEIFGTADETRRKVEEMRRRVADIEARTATATGVKVFVQISKEPLFTIGRESFLTEIISRAGGVSVTADLATAYPRFSKETALALAPEAIILSESDDNPEPNEVFKDSPAVKNRRVFKISADLLSRPSPRIVDALERIAKDLHPEDFR
ncbi:MAG TPA: cobalamin-binding protein [Pyrinomonadaceae bacterium]|nr:cobalamin-binding protein [Pyrinomonadaceae bacterium]